MNDAVNAKFAIFGLLRTLDVLHGGEAHDEFAAIAESLGLQLPTLPPEAEANGEQESEQDAHGRWIDECLDLANPNATTFLADLFANWTAWTEREKAFTGTVNAFSRALVRRWGEERKDRANTGIFFKGVKLK
jgi:hypothetical protein